ncbi:MAG TPA: glycosyltransferase [Rudaea sp.]|nr:glycosyltransferase [Rudaea sp.]
MANQRHVGAVSVAPPVSAACPPAAQPGLASGTSVQAPTASAILVLGMHRSGTSALARVLGLMGAYIGEPEVLLPSDPDDNPTGYWERAEINALHDRFLESHGWRWDRVAGFEAHQLESEAARVLAAGIGAAVSNLAAHGRPWLIKDPRLCLTLPHWQEQLRAPACVVVVRDPREIAASMHSGPRGELTSPYVLALWEKYLGSSLSALRGRRAVFVSYAAFLEDPPAQCERLLRALADLGVGGLRAPAATELAEFLDARLRRSAPQSHVNLTPAQTALYAWLDAQSRSSGTVAVNGFPENGGVDAALAEFESAFRYHRELGHGEAMVETGARLAKIESMLHDQARVREDLERERQQGEAARHALARERERSETLAHQVHQIDARLATAMRDGEHHRVRADAAQQHAEALQQHIDALQNHADALQHLTGTLRQHVADLQASIGDLKRSWSWRLSAPLRALVRVLQWPLSAKTEQHLHRWYYGLPGVDATRKRALVVWLHRHAAWLTRRTLSYQLHARSEAATAPAPPGTAVARRMDEARAAAILAGLAEPVRISIVMPVYNVERRWLLAAVESVRRQFYPHWELCIADDASSSKETLTALAEIAKFGDPRIKLTRLPKNLGIAGASNAALALATGEFVGLLDNDDELTRDALLEAASTIAAENADVLYSDEDKLDADGQHVEPHFKPDFNGDYFFSINYVCHFAVLRRSLIERIGGFRTGFDGAQDYDLLLRATEAGERVAHIPKVLYHWRKTASSTATASQAKPKSWAAGERALAESVARRGIDADVVAGPYPNTYRVRRRIKGSPLVSMLVPFRDKPELLATCVRSILAKTEYTNFEILGIDNGSTEAPTHELMRELEKQDPRVRFVRHDVPFNYSAINNFAARQARGEHLLLLNNDTEAIAPEWLRAMLEHSQRPEVGVVGAKLLYPDRRIQHAGVIVGIGGVAGHAHLMELADGPGYFARAQLAQDLSAVTFACAMTRRTVFEELGGLNETELAIAFNDIDYCLRAREAGYLVVYTPFAELYHHESRTRGYEDNPEKQARFFREISYMQQRHRAVLDRGDPYYNPNLRLDTNDFSAKPGYVEALPV